MADLFLGRPRSRRYPKFNIRRDIPRSVNLLLYYQLALEPRAEKRFGSISGRSHSYGLLKIVPVTAVVT